MESLLILMPLAIVIVAIALGIFFWAVKSGQFDDLDTEGKRILFDRDANTSNSDPKLNRHEDQPAPSAKGEGDKRSS